MRIGHLYTVSTITEFHCRIATSVLCFELNPTFEIVCCIHLKISLIFDCFVQTSRYCPSLSK